MAKVLLVDDERTNLSILALLLRNNGYDVVAHETAEEAAASLTEQPFDILVTDLRMSPINGLELARRAKIGHPEMPVIIMTAYCTPETREEAQSLGVFDFINKPCTADKLLASIRDGLSSVDQAE